MTSHRSNIHSSLPPCASAMVAVKASARSSGATSTAEWGLRTFVAFEIAGECCLLPCLVRKAYHIG